MTRRINLAIVGAPGVVSESLLATLEERHFPLGELHLLGEEAQVGETMRGCGKSLTVKPVSQFDFTQVELAIFCGDEALSYANAPAAAECGCTVIDCSGAFRDDPAVPLVLPEINPDALDGFRERNIIATPSATTTMLLTVLKPLHEAVGIVSADVTTLEAVSEAGKAGVDELSGQVVSLLNMRDAQIEVFPQRIAFNLIPQVGGLLENGYTEGEVKVLTEAQKILPEEVINLNLTAIQVPVFYGDSMSIHLQMASTMLAEEAKALLAETPGVVLSQASSGPSPALDAANNDGIHVGRVRESLTQDGGLNLWVSSDNSRKGAALNAVQIAEILEKCYI